MNAIVFFDECEGLFARRTAEIQDAQDRHVNTDSAFLLQAVEDYPGIVLLATNQKGNVDPAFVRRLRFVLEFAKPEAAQRLEIWRATVRGLAGEASADALARPLAALAESVEATGAQIKYAVLGAVFAAARRREALGVEHLLHGLNRELGKEGRALGPRDRERLRVK
jgi:SpoVK/Ycf46/Vps4 family AAA+-type ATPase